MHKKIIIVGAGPAGVGMACLLKRCKVDAIILDQGRIGESFLSWPKEMRFISPSFTGNFFGAVDLNAITPDSSPAFGLQTEHPTGAEYAQYLRDIVEHYELDVREHTKVMKIETQKPFRLHTKKELFTCDYLIWAGGEFQFPTHIPHTTRIRDYSALPRTKHIIIGGAESGIDAAYHLTRRGDEVVVLDKSAPWNERYSDSSYGLSPYSLDRLRAIQETGLATFIDEHATEITQDHVQTENHTFPATFPALNATGFDMKKSLAGELFTITDGYPEITEHDESTKVPGVFLVGPRVRHEGAIFCFIYKFRQRFGVVAKRILASHHPSIAEYADKGFLLEDLSCCGNECEC